MSITLSRYFIPLLSFENACISIKISSPNLIDTVYGDSPTLKFSSDWFIEFLCKFISKI